MRHTGHTSAFAACHWHAVAFRVLLQHILRIKFTVDRPAARPIARIRLDVQLKPIPTYPTSHGAHVPLFRWSVLEEMNDGRVMVTCVLVLVADTIMLILVIDDDYLINLIKH